MSRHFWGIEIEEDWDKKSLVSTFSRKVCGEERVKAIMNSLSDREIEILGIFALNKWSLEGREIYMWGMIEEELEHRVFYSLAKGRSKTKNLVELFLLVRARKYDNSGPLIYVVPNDF